MNNTDVIDFINQIIEDSTNYTKLYNPSFDGYIPLLSGTNVSKCLGDISRKLKSQFPDKDLDELLNCFYKVFKEKCYFDIKDHYDKFMFINSVREIVVKGIVGTKRNYGNSISTVDTINDLINGHYDVISRVEKTTGEELRSKLSRIKDSIDDFRVLIFNIMLKDYLLKHDKNNKIMVNDINGNVVEIGDYLVSSIGVTAPLKEVWPYSLDKLKNNEQLAFNINSLIDTFITQYADTFVKNNNYLFEQEKNVDIEVTESLKGCINNLGGKCITDRFVKEYTVSGIQLSIASDKGKRSRNEDSVGTVNRILSDGSSSILNIVCDGMGGHENGDIASSYTIKTIQEWFNSLDESMLLNYDLFISEFNKIINSINYQINRNLTNSGTTIALTVTNSDNTYVANIGDSLIFALDKENNLTELSDNHSYSQMLANLGEIPNDYESIRRNNNPSIVRAVGIYDNTYVSSKCIKNEGQRIIISSDGVTDLISEDNLKQMLAEGRSAQEIIDKAINNPDVYGDMKSKDNASAIIFDLPVSLSYSKGGR